MMALVLCALSFTAVSAQAQIAKVGNFDGRTLFVNAEPPTVLKLTPRRNSIFLPSTTSITGRARPAMNMDRDGAEKLVREAAERHSVDPALVRAVIETESNWNAGAVSRKGAVGLMQLIPTTAQRFGVNDLYSPQQNVDAGVKYLKTLLQRYNGNLDLALAAYNAGEGAVDRAHGVPSLPGNPGLRAKGAECLFSAGLGTSGRRVHQSSRHPQGDRSAGPNGLYQ